jgi:HEAT repeat protein
VGIAQVATILKQLAALLKNMRTYDRDNPVIARSFGILLASLQHFLNENKSLTLLVREDTLAYGDSVCFRSTDRADSLAFALFRDGIRLITFKAGLSAAEIEDFAWAVHEARGADPYQADLVTILWEKELEHINYRAVDAYLEDGERQKIEDLAVKYMESNAVDDHERNHLSPDFVFNELGLSITGPRASAQPVARTICEVDTRNSIREILEEDEGNLLSRCIEICTEIAYTADTDEMFNSVVSLLGRICERLVCAGQFLAACCIVSDLRLLASEEDTSAARRSSIMDTISRLGEPRTINLIGDQLCDLTESRLEEVFAYLALMTPTAVEPLCSLLSESEQKTVRYLLCRAISIVARTETDRLRRFMLDHRWFVVRNMVMIAGMIGSHEVLPILRSIKSHKEPRVRKELARSLGRIGSDLCLDMFEDLLRDENKSVRLAAITAVRDIGSDQAMECVESIILEGAFGNKPMDEKRETMITYGSLDGRSFDLLSSIATGDRKGFNEETRACAVYGLASTENSRAREVLKSLTEVAENAIRCAAAEVLAEIDPYQAGKESHEEMYA